MGTGRARSTPNAPVWERWPRDRILDLRFKDLGLTLAKSPAVLAVVEEFLRELADKGLRYRPPVWLGIEWYTPPERPGISIPFYLAHPRLRRIERELMFEAEGSSRREALRLLRHEAGHAFQFAYALHKRKRWREHFGKSSLPYPEAYKPKAYSRDFVLHLDNHYAQAHPDEDFAETFAVWLSPTSRWRTRYAKWPALRKLEYVDELMAEIANTPPVVQSRAADQRLSHISTTLREHYDERRARYGLDDVDVYDRDLRKLFAPNEPGTKLAPASKWLRRNRRELIALIGRWTQQYPYTVNDIYDFMIARASAMKLRVPEHMQEEELMREVAVMLAVQAMAHLQRGGRWITL